VDVGVLHLLQEKQARSLPFSQDDTPVNSSSSSLFCGVWSFNPVTSDLHQVYEAVNHLQSRNINSVAWIGKDLLAARFGLLMMVATDEVLPAQSPAHMTLRYIEFGNRAPVNEEDDAKINQLQRKLPWTRSVFFLENEVTLRNGTPSPGGGRDWTCIPEAGGL
jgi:hypothetical protein